MRSDQRGLRVVLDLSDPDLSLSPPRDRRVAVPRRVAGEVIHRLPRPDGRLGLVGCPRRPGWMRGILRPVSWVFRALVSGAEGDTSGDPAGWRPYTTLLRLTTPARLGATTRQTKDAPRGSLGRFADNLLAF